MDLDAVEAEGAETTSSIRDTPSASAKATVPAGLPAVYLNCEQKPVRKPGS